MNDTIIIRWCGYCEIPLLIAIINGRIIWKCPECEKVTSEEL